MFIRKNGVYAVVREDLKDLKSASCQPEKLFGLLIFSIGKFVKFELLLHGPKWLSKDGKDPIGNTSTSFPETKPRRNCPERERSSEQSIGFSWGVALAASFREGVFFPRLTWDYELFFVYQKDLKLPCAWWPTFFWVKWFHHIWPLVMAGQPTPS